MTDSENENEKRESDELEILIDQVKEVHSKEDFLEILWGISEICMKDKEAWERRMVHFVDVVIDSIKYDLIDVPEDQDWKWLADLFMTGAFKD